MFKGAYAILLARVITAVLDVLEMRRENIYCVVKAKNKERNGNCNARLISNVHDM